MPYPSPFPSLSIPDVDLWSLLFERKHRCFPRSKEIFTDAATGRTYTFDELKHTAHEFGKGLKARWGWKRGDVLAFYTPNSVDTAPVTLGALWAGAVITPANPLYSADELTFQLRDSGAKAIVTQLSCLEVARKAARNVGIPEERIMLIGDQRDTTGQFRHFCSVRSTSYTGWYAKAKIDPKKDLAVIVYSSGTTGLPKGVCLSHYNLVANIIQFAYMDGRNFLPYGGLDGKGDKMLGVLPLFHIYGLTCGILTSIYCGWQMVILEKFDLEKALQTIQNYGITFAYIPPPVVLAFGKDPRIDEYDISSLRMLHSGAAPLTRELTEAVWQRLKIPVKQGFGLSETCGVVNVQSPDEWAKYMGSVGKLAPNMEAKIVDDSGKEVAEGEVGELWLKGPNIFLGYLNGPDKTKDAFSECGCFKTGDLFRVDAWGNFYCVDRLKELIKYKGWPVAPAELEGLLISHEDISDVCVIGVEDKELATEVPRAYIVLKNRGDGNKAKAHELSEWLAKQVAPHKKLRGGIRFVEQVPKSPSGKILRRIMRDQVRREERAAGSKL